MQKRSSSSESDLQRAAAARTLNRFPQLWGHHHQVEMRRHPNGQEASCDICGCLLWCRTKYGFAGGPAPGWRCARCMPPLEMGEELRLLVEATIQQKGG